MARENILKNCAIAGDMPAVLLNEETYVEGFGEGTEDARRVAMFVKRMREEMDPQYRWFDEIAMHRAWCPEFYATVQKRYPTGVRQDRLHRSLLCVEEQLQGDVAQLARGGGQREDPAPRK